MRFCAIPAWPLSRGVALAVLVSWVIDGWFTPGVVAPPALVEGGFTVAPPTPGVVAVAPPAPMVCDGTDGVLADGAATGGGVTEPPRVAGGGVVCAKAVPAAAIKARVNRVPFIASSSCAETTEKNRPAAAARSAARCLSPTFDFSRASVAAK